MEYRGIESNLIFQRIADRVTNARDSDKKHSYNDYPKHRFIFYCSTKKAITRRRLITPQRPGQSIS